MNSLKYYLKKAEDFLRAKEIEKPRLEAQLLFAARLHLNRYELYSKENLPLQSQEVNDLRKLLLRKAKGEPTAYIINEKEFFSLSFYVDNSVLIPRPETEELVDFFLKDFENFYVEKNARILDLCCGSGVIGLSIFSKLKNISMCFADVSEDAISVCKRNYQKIFLQDKDSSINDSEVHFYVSNLFENPILEQKKFNAIVCNPPYITEQEFIQLDNSVKNYEPTLALKIPNNNFFENLFEQCYLHLETEGVIFLETNFSLIQEQCLQMQKIGFQEIEILNDLSKKERFIKAKKY